MPNPIAAADMLNREFLEIRTRLIDIAAALDRIEQREGASAAKNDARYKQIGQALHTLSESGADRAQRMQMIFSDAYDGAWKRDMQPFIAGHWSTLSGGL